MSIMAAKLSPAVIKVLATIALIILVIVGYMLWLGGRDTKQETKAAVEQGVRTDKATSDIIKDSAEKREQAATQEAGVAETRVTYHHIYEEARRNDPVVRDFDATPVPQRLRDAARERRLSRERLGCTGDGCGGNGEAPGPRR